MIRSTCISGVYLRYLLNAHFEYVQRVVSIERETHTEHKHVQTSLFNNFISKWTTYEHYNLKCQNLHKFNFFISCRNRMSGCIPRSTTTKNEFLFFWIVEANWKLSNIKKIYINFVCFFLFTNRTSILMNRKITNCSKHDVK